MRIVIVALLCCILFSCSKSNKAENISGTIDGKPALALYGSSNGPADYILLGEDSTLKQMSYNGVILTYHTTTYPEILISNTLPVARATLITGTGTTLTIDTTFGFTFGSKQYSSR